LVPPFLGRCIFIWQYIFIDGVEIRKCCVALKEVKLV
jgi:hypothetical protein